MAHDRDSPVLAFADFELDPRRHELRRNGRRVPLQEQPYQILACLLERPGDIVSRETLRERLWPSGTYVEFEKSINVAVMKLRDALGDSAEAPRFVETVPRLGYRFVGALASHTPARPAAADAPIQPGPGGTAGPAVTAEGPTRFGGRRRLAMLGTIAVVATAAALGAAAWRSRVATERSQVRSLAVLPFVDQSPQAGEEYLAAGLTEELISRLAQIGTLKVTSRTSSEALRDSKETVPVLARRLDVDAVVEGSIARFGSRVRISAQLVHGATDRHLWARRYEEDERDLLNLQNAIARDIAREIAATLRPQEASRLARRETVDPEAYREYLKGRYLLARRSIDGFLGALRHFRRAVELDDQFALGYLGLAMTFEGMESLSVLDGAATRVREAAERALELDPDLAEAHAALGAALFTEHRFQEAEAALEHAIELSPSSAYAHLKYGHLLADTGRHGEALVEARRALELDPLSPLFAMSLAWTHYLALDHPAAIAACRRALELDPNYPETLQMLARAQSAAGDHEAAFAAYSGWARAAGFSAADLLALEARYTASGLPGIHRFLLELEVRDEEETGEVWPARRARLHALLGEKDEAFRWLERTATDGHRVLGLGSDPAFDSLRGDSRFEAHLQRRTQRPPTPLP
jgi:TolB-like protein/DNA-binding winged helix-turn-helix (wHTH) protein/Tfp pilus assembly protein PilF